MNMKTFIDAPTGLLLGTLVLIVMPIFGGVLSPPNAGAQIEPATTVTFFENDSLSDTVCSYQPGTYDQTADLEQFADISPAFTNGGYTFTGWNTQANGSGTPYADGAPYSFAESVGLYAQWSPLPSLTISFSDNGGVGNVSSLSDPSGSSVALPSGAGLSFSGYTFAGWNTEANGLGTEYAAGQSFETESSVTLYAQWTQDPLTEISLNANGGTSSISTLTGVVGSTVTLPSGAEVEDAGYTLTSWNTAANGSGTDYQPGQSVSLSSSMTLYAQWTPLVASTPPTSGSPNPPSTPTSTVTVNFVTEGGSGSLTTIDNVTGASITLPSASALVREGYKLTSWNTEADGKGTSYAPGASVTLATSLTLYAQWTPSSAAPEVLFGAIGDFANLSTSLNVSLERQVRELAAELKAKRYKAVRLYGYSASTGLASLDKALSAARASNVASYLRAELRTMKVTGVTIVSSGEGSVAGKTSSLYSRVEIFVS